MKQKTKKIGRFQSKASEILSQNTPSSIKGFINDTLKPEDTGTQTLKPANPQTHNEPIEGFTNSPKLGRLHIEVRLELVQQLMQFVYARKCDPDQKGRATQRAVIEEALEEYFQRHSSK